MLIKLLLLFGLPLAALELELFRDWHWDAKRDGSVPEAIKQTFQPRGWEVCCWDLEVYRPCLIGWKLVRSWQELKWRLGFELPVIDKQKLWVFWNLGLNLRGLDFSRVPKDLLVLVMYEPPTVQKELYDPKIQAHFGKIFTWDDDLVDNNRFFKYYYPVMMPRLEGIPSFEERKFCCMINRRLCSKHPKQLYSEREKTIRFFEDKVGEFNLYGMYWEKRNFKNFRGYVEDKIDILKSHKFCICYENTKEIRGYITEKIFHCFAAGTVPVYWGASNVTDYIPPACFIDRRKFKDNQELYDFIKSVTKEQYQAYVDAAAEFLQSPEAALFTDATFAKALLQLVQ